MTLDVVKPSSGIFNKVHACAVRSLWFDLCCRYVLAPGPCTDPSQQLWCLDPRPERNPSLKQQLFSYAILGFALSEAMGLFCLMVAFLILFAM
ncbi:hypothetical protein JZ751_025433 [Albula glossodonta]|uniref:ATP synthase lipid-binding protein n=1 Tax=Albula glossodonta TaxID=121402 RepID=A0A8T2NE09_9TELE|nr:hypothetical protein JZ751_025433 [Albula glossodonta]